MSPARLFRSPHPGAAGPDALLALALALAGAYLLMFLIVAVARLSYPFELEWLEGLVLEHVRRILTGHSIYAAPTLEFVPLNYTPFYYYVSAAAALVVGPSFVPLRLVSLCAALAVLALAALLVRRETGRMARKASQNPPFARVLWGLSRLSSKFALPTELIAHRLRSQQGRGPPPPGTSGLCGHCARRLARLRRILENQVDLRSGRGENRDGRPCCRASGLPTAARARRVRWHAALLCFHTSQLSWSRRSLPARHV